MKEQPKIILLLETSRQLGREMLRGAATWSQMHGPVTLAAHAGHVEQSLPDFRGEQNFGVVSRLSVDGLVRAFRKYRFPLLALEPASQELLDIKEELGLAEIRSNAETIATMGVDYLWNDGFRHFAFCGFPGKLWSQRRSKAFTEQVRQRGGSCAVYPEAEQTLTSSRERLKLKKWLHSLPKPIGMLACDDDRAHQVLNVCEEESIRIPQDISIIGVGNDEILCDLASPPLSSIAIDFVSTGYEAVGVLVDMISGKTKRPPDITMNPRWVTPRLSTDFLAVKDAMVVRSLQFIRQNYLRAIGVDDVVRYIGVSRRTLEVRFSKATERTVAEEIQYHRLQRAKRLLTQTDEPVTNIAEPSGFYNFRSLLHAFHVVEGCTPLEYRERHGSITKRET
ncbi:MAG: DNA-binding transcriptional regulator [Planctomycetaceae bacterium]|nr:DNA-binding transcriptional regulator [Planctomycetaceae bacterium]